MNVSEEEILMIRRAMLLEIDRSGRTALAMPIEWFSRGTQSSIDDAKHVDLLECLDQWDRLTIQKLALAGGSHPLCGQS